jgi:hypothetical protein
MYSKFNGFICTWFALAKTFPDLLIFLNFLPRHIHTTYYMYLFRQILFLLNEREHNKAITITYTERHSLLVFVKSNNTTQVQKRDYYV